MSIMYQIDPAHQLLFIRMTGVIHPDDLVSLLNAVTADPNLHPQLNYLGDYQAAVLEPISPPALFGLSFIVHRLMDQFRPALRHPVKQAVVISTTNPKGFRELHDTILAGSREQQFFTDLAAAQAWLGLPAGWTPPEPQPLPDP